MNDKLRHQKEHQQYLLKLDLASETMDKDRYTLKEVDEEICKRLQDDVYDEYLVDGAVLSCTKARWLDYKLSDGDLIKIDDLADKIESGRPTEFLRVFENPIFSNDLRHATIADTKQGWNIMPFPCNCMEPASPEQEKIIKANKIDCQSHGVCKYLMDLETEWENIDFDVPYAEFPNAKVSSSLDNELVTGISDSLLSERKAGITMTSVLFCRHGGFIYPMTSGQTIRMTVLEEFAKEYGFTARQYMALYEIRGYLDRNPELCIGTSIFAFEGLAAPWSDSEAEWNGKNKYHPNGQFGAVLIVTVDGRLDCALMKASTLPDDMETYATVCEGVYEIKDGSHKGYAALWVNNNENILAYNSITGNDYANAIHFHMAGKLNKDHPGDGSYSQGCITVPVSEYAEFGVRVGFINEDADENIGKNHKYQEAKGKLPYGEYMKDFEGHMVIDRQYYEDSGGYLKFNGPKGEK